MNNQIKKLFGHALIRKGIGDSSYYFLANGSRNLLGFLIIPILARKVGVEDFANFDLFLVILNLLTVFVSLGFDSSIIILLKEAESDIKKISFYYVISLVISSIFVIFLFLVLLCIFLFVDKLFTLASNLWVLLFIQLLFSVINYHTFSFLRWRGEAKYSALINLLGYVLGIMAGLVFLFLCNEIYYYFVGLIIGTFLASMFSLYVARTYLKNFCLLNDFKILIIDFIHLSLPYVPNYIGNNLLQVGDRFIILFLIGKYELAQYAMIIKLAMLPSFFTDTLSSGFLPVMFKNYQTKEGIVLIRNYFHFYLLSMIIFFIVFYFISDYILFFFGGKNYQEVSNLLPVMLVAMLFMNITLCSGFGFLIQRKVHYKMYITLSSVIINVILSTALGLLMGLPGVIFGTLLTGIIRSYFFIIISERLYYFGYNISLFISISLLLVLLSVITII